MQKTFLMALALVFTVFAGCYYNPSGDHFEEIAQEGTPPEIEVELNFDTDTLYVNNNEWIMFHYTQNSDKVNWARFIIDGQETSPNDEKQGGLELYYYLPGFTPGIHSLSMQLFTRSGTGSIADYVGAEGFLMQKDWVLVVVDDDEIAPNIIDTSFENGLLKLRWKEYKGLNFESYRVYKFVQPTALPNQLVATITDQHQTSVTDPNYHGENSIYFVRVNERYTGNSIQIEGPLPAVSAGNNTQGEIVLHWEKPPYVTALKGYRILDDELSWTSEGFVPLRIVDNPQTDSVVITDAWFGMKRTFWVQLDPKGMSYVENWSRPVMLGVQVKASYGKESPVFYWATTGTQNKIYMAAGNGFRIFNTETLENKLVGDLPEIQRFNVSPANKYLASQIWGTNKILFYDLEKQQHKIIDISDQIPGMAHLVSVSDKGTGMVMAGSRTALVDFNSEQILSEKELDSNGLYRNQISGDGNYFLLETYAGYGWYSCKNNTISELTTINEAVPEPQFSDFLPGEPTKVVIADMNSVSVYNCETQALLYHQTFASGVETLIYHLVKSSGELFIREGDDMVLLNLETGDRTFLGKSMENNRWEMVYNHGQILWSEGRRLDVNDKL
ncbi:MAG TPA: hypothetical protein PK335_09600 [Draconibacterium sp.]|nr:hypothetical protein [Draconibacterium sp.]